MLRHRLIAGTAMAAAIGGVLVADSYLAPYYPFLLVVAVIVGVGAAHELFLLLPPANRPDPLCEAGPLVVLLANWYGPFAGAHGLPAPGDHLGPVLTAFAGVVLVAFLAEMRRYTAPGGNVTRLAHAVFLAAYLGLLPSFLMALRWLPEHAELALTLAIFVPKVGDIGAYFAGRFLGRHRFAPLLSPKKTWEGFVGGLFASAATAVGLSFVEPIFRHGPAEAAAFGVVVGTAGVLGDLAESMVKRDADVKDAGRGIPGFGGLLDVIDSVLFAGPVAYLWFTR